jgi:hypothetical protein
MMERRFTMPWSRRFRSSLADVGRTLPALVGCLILGCGSGPRAYRISGKVNFAGNPVPAGTIYFTPDAGKNNSGPTGFAQIKDGRYDTGASGGQGMTGGPMIVKIEGSDGTSQLFRTQEIPVELPSEDTTKDFDVPAAAGKGMPKRSGPAP